MIFLLLENRKIYKKLQFSWSFLYMNETKTCFEFLYLVN